MEQFQSIIEKGEVPAKDISTGLFRIGTIILMIGGCFYALYAMNFKENSNPFNQPVDFLNIAFVILIILGIYLLVLSKKKLRVIFYEDSSSVEIKKNAIDKTANLNKWKLKKSGIHYFLFWENNLLLRPSYYITIVFDEKGFYINCYPFLDKVLDFGLSKKHSDEIYDDLKNCL